MLIAPLPAHIQQQHHPAHHPLPLPPAITHRYRPKLTKAMAFVQQPAGGQVRTNNHVERLNRRLRFAEKVRYRWRKRKWVVRWVVLLLDVCWQQATEAATANTRTKRQGERSPPQPSVRGRKKVA